MYEILDKRVIEMATPLDDYQLIHHNSSLFDAVSLMASSRAGESSGKIRHPLLVIDDNRRVIGKVGPLCCMKALNPSFCLDFDDIEIMKRIEEFHMNYLECLICKQILDECKNPKKKEIATELKVINVMYPIYESVDGDSSILYAIHKIIDLNSISLLVTMKSEVVGLIHLFDIYNELTK